MESFFSISVSGTSEIELLEFLHRRYNNVDSLMRLDITDFCRFLKIAKEKEEDERLRSQWVAMLPFMSMQQLKFMSFEDYKDQCTGKNIDIRPADDIIKELENLHGKKLV